MRILSAKALCLLIFACCLWTFEEVHAVDPSSAILLRSGAQPVGPEDLDSSRFNVRTSNEPKFEPRAEPPKIESSRSENSRTESVEPKRAKLTPKAAEAPVLSETPPAPVSEDKRPITEQVKVLLLGGDEEDIQEYKKQIHPLDPRQNTAEILLAPVYFYNDSSSSFSIRDYTASGPGVQAGLTLWLTPFFGIQGRHFASLASEIKSDGTKDVLPAEYQMSEAGLRFRKHFGTWRKAPHLAWGLDYFEQKMKVSSEATDRVGYRSAGLSLSIEAVLPRSLTYAHVIGVELRPKVDHKESSGDAEIRSGLKDESNAVGAWVGGQITLDRRNQFFWKLRHSIEKNTFEGEGSVTDPKTGLTPDGVSVTNSLTMFSIGFKWGN